MGTSTIRLRSIKFSLPFSLPLCHSRDKLFQALSRLSVLQATESWAGPGNEASHVLSGLHLEIDPRGGGAKPCVHVHKHMYSRGVWGHAPPENFRF